jgi:hypothetical protein
VPLLLKCSRKRGHSQFFWLILLVLVCALSLRDSTSSARAQTPASGALILGRVVDAGTDQPIAGAEVRLSRESVDATASPGTSEVVITDTAGQFLFRDLPAGVFQLRAQAPGSIPGSYGQRQPGGLDRRLTLGQGERRTDLVVSLWKYSAIAGTLRDEVGEPVVGAAVRLVQRALQAGGTRFIAGAVTNTDDRGAFRFGQLMPGSYTVVAPSTTAVLPEQALDVVVNGFTGIARSGSVGSLPPLVSNMVASGHLLSPEGVAIPGGRLQVPILPRSATAVAPAPDPDGVLHVYRTTYHPTAIDLPGAVFVDLSPGESRTGVDLTLTLSRGYTVSGTISVEALDAANHVVRLYPRGARPLSGTPELDTAVAVTDSRGRFELRGVPSGQYTAALLEFGRSMVAADGGAAVQPTLSGSVDVTVGATDVDGVTLHIDRGARVTGQVRFEVAGQVASSDYFRTQIVATPVDSPLLPGNARAQVQAGGLFETTGYPAGRYVLTVNGPRPGWVVSSVSAGGRSILDVPIELTSGVDLTGVVVTVTDRVSSVTGRVRPADAAADAAVILLPGDVEAWIAVGLPAAAAQRVALSDNGEFRMSRLRPGDYLLVAVDARRTINLGDPDDVRRLARAANAITLTVGDTRDVTLSVVR